MASKKKSYVINASVVRVCVYGTWMFKMPPVLFYSNKLHGNGFTRTTLQISIITIVEYKNEMLSAYDQVNLECH